jgi:hypothetical protein
MVMRLISRQVQAAGWLFSVLAFVAGAAHAAAFTPGNLVLYRVGDGTTAASAAATAVYLDEYRPDGTLVQTIAMPTAGGSAPLTNALTASSTGSEGLLSRSTDGACLLVPGYSTPVGTAAVAGTASTAVQRSLAIVSAAGAVDTTTTLGTNAFNTKSPRAAVSDNCSHAWLSGDGSASAKQGIWYATKGGSSATQVYSTNAVHGLLITNGRLWASLKSSTLNVIGSGLPTATGQTGAAISSIATVGNYRGMALLDLQTGVSGSDTLYLANNSTGTIDKYSYDGTLWTSRGSLTATGVGNLQGLAALNLGDGRVALFYTDSNTGNLYRSVDGAGPTATLAASTPAIIATATGDATTTSTNVFFYGVALAPEASLPVAAPGSATQAGAGTVTATSFVAQWNAPSTGGAVAYYVVEVSSDNFATAPSQTLIVPGTQTSVTVTGLSGATHYFRVRAVNSLGASTDLVSSAIAAPNTAPSLTFAAVTDGTDSVGYPVTVGDTHDPIASPGLSFTVSDAETPTANLSVAVHSSNTALLPDSGLGLSGCSTGTCLLTINPSALTGAGYVDVTVSVTDGGDPQGQNQAVTSVTRHFAVSTRSAADLAGGSNPRWIAGRSDSSDAIVSGAPGSPYVLVADDEPGNVINLWDRTRSGQPVKVFDISADLQVNTGKTGVDCTFAATIASYAANDCNTNLESDMEAATRVGNVTYWTGSHSNSSSGQIRPARWRYFAYTLDDSTPSNPSLTFVGYYKYLRPDLINWDRNNMHALGANYFGLAASTADGNAPEGSSFDGFNIEGLTSSPTDSAGWFAFRAPLVPAPGQAAVTPGSNTGRTHALIIQAANYRDTTQVLTPSGGSYNASQPSAGLGLPIRLDLGGRGIRDIKKNAAGQYLIIAGPANSATGTAPYDFRLFTWDGSFDAGTGLATNLQMRATALGSVTAPNYGGSVEGIVEVPDTTNPASTVDLISDSGDVVFYGDGIGAKDLDGDVNAIQHNYPIKKSRVDTFTLGAVVSYDSKLAALSLSNATLSPAFSAGVYGYSAVLSNGANAVQVSATPDDVSHAGMTLNSSTLLAGQASSSVAAGSTLSLVVTAQDGSTSTYTITVGQATQSISLGSAPAVTVGGTGTLSASATSGLTVSWASQTPSICTVSGQVVSGVAGGTCNLTASQAGNTVYAAATSQNLSLQVTARSFSGTPAGSSGSVGAGFTGGGSSATLSRARFIAVSGDVGSPAAVAPNGVSFPYGLLDMVISNTTLGGTVQLTLTYPQTFPAGARYWKYGKTSPADTAHWYVFPGASISGNTVTLTLTDGGAGDDDGQIDGTITDPGGVGLGGADPLSVPALSEMALAFLGMLVAAVSLLGFKGVLLRRPA